MGGPGSGRWPRGTSRAWTGNPKAKYAAERNPQRSIPASPGVPQPDGDPNWSPIVASFWRSIGKSPEAAYLQPSDYMQLWVAMDILDEQYTGTRFFAGLVKEAFAIVSRIIPSRSMPELPDDEPEDDKYSDANSPENVRRLFAVGDDDDDEY